MRLTEIELNPWKQSQVIEVIARFDDGYLLRMHYNEDRRTLWYLAFDHEKDAPQGPYYLFESRCLTPGNHAWIQPMFGRHMQAVMDAVTHPFESIPLIGDRTQLARLVEIVTPIGDHIEAFLHTKVPFCR